MHLEKFLFSTLHNKYSITFEAPSSSCHAALPQVMWDLSCGHKSGERQWASEN